MKIEYDYNYWKNKGHEAGNTTKTSEKFCADRIKKLKAKNTMVSFGEGKPDILVCKKNKSFEFYEVKPYLEQWGKIRAHRLAPSIARPQKTQQTTIKKIQGDDEKRIKIVCNLL